MDHEVVSGTLEYAMAYLETLSNRGIPIYCILGTHDLDAAYPQYQGSVDGVAWLREQVSKGFLAEVTTDSTRVGDGPVAAYGISASNIGLAEAGTYRAREWSLFQIAFGVSTPGSNVPCLYDGVTPYRDCDATVDLDRLLEESRVSFDCVLVGDEHRPKNDDFESGYSFETRDGTPVVYTGPAIRIRSAYRDHEAFVTELSISSGGVSATRFSL